MPYTVLKEVQYFKAPLHVVLTCNLYLSVSKIQGSFIVNLQQSVAQQNLKQVLVPCYTRKNKTIFFYVGVWKTS